MPFTAHAQDTEAADATAVLIAPLTITKLDDMNFGDIAGPSGGTVVLTPTSSPTCTASGGIVQTAECIPARFAGSATFGERVRIRRPVGNIITLTGPGADMTVTNLTINGDPMLVPVRSNLNWEQFRIDDPNGLFIFRVGGTLNVNPNQAPGVYVGTFDIRLDYN